MNPVDFQPGTSDFLREIRECLSTLPVGFFTKSVPNSENFYFEIKNPKSTSLYIFPKSIAHFPQEANSHIREFHQNGSSVILWEDIWYSKRKIVESRIKALLGISERIPARLTQVRRLDRPTTQRFLEENHLQIATLSKYKYGLYLPKKHFRVIAEPPEADDLLVAVATFARPRVFEREGTPHRSYELVRFANLLDTTVVGGLDKLLSHFVKEHQPDDLMTYADLEWSSGRSYLKLGFKPQEDVPPQEFLVKSATMERFYPHRLPDEISQRQEFVKIKNAGSRKFVKNFHAKSPSH